MEALFVLAVAGCGLTVALTIGAVVLLKLGVFVKYALRPEQPEDRLGDYRLEESHKVGEGAQRAQGEQNGSD